MQNNNKPEEHNSGQLDKDKNVSSARPLPELATQYQDPYSYPEGVAYLDRQYVEMSQAKISVLDWGFLHSDATYDVMHAWNGRIFRPVLYLERFFAGMDKLQMGIPYNREQVMEIIENCVALSGLRNAYIELICTRGCSPTFSRDPRDAINRFMIFAVPFSSVANAEQLEHGLHIALTDRVRISPASVDSSIKNYHWLDLVGGLYDAYQRAADTALLIDSNGNVAEGPGFNVFVVKNKQLATPDYSVLPGITRRTVMDLCLELNLHCEARDITPEELRNADEVFVTSTAGGVMPVSRIDSCDVGAGNVGPITLLIKKTYWDKHTAEDWSSPVHYP